MAQDKTALFNLALVTAGARELVSSPDEDSRAAEMCSLWYDKVRDYVLKSAPWPSAKRVQYLALAKERTGDQWSAGDPDPGYLYAYHKPSDMLYPRYLSGYEIFELGNLDAATPALMTNMEQALLVYTFRQENIGLWDESLFMAIAHALASFICLPLGGKNQRSALVREQANEIISTARTQAANSDFVQRDSVPDWISARGYAESAPTQRFIYPYGPLLAATI